VTKNTIISLIFKTSSFLFAVLIFTLSSIPYAQSPFNFRMSDKLLHLLVYLFFSILLFFAFHTSIRPFWQRNAYLFSLIIGVIYGLSDELHQGFVPGRQKDVFDFLSDLIGVLLGLFIIYLSLKFRSKNEANR
jgi:VanZ family protein